MNKEEVINKINEMTVETFFSKTLFVQQKKVIELIEQLDEPEAGHADEAPRYVKNILARLRELPLHDREVWLKAIMGEFEQDFSHAKWREGYEQGKLEGMVEREKVIVPQFVADWYEENKMNKRIKKKKAKQALLREQERLNQELAKISPEELEELARAVKQVLKNMARTLASIFDGLAAFFKGFDKL